MIVHGLCSAEQHVKECERGEHCSRKRAHVNKTYARSTRTHLHVAEGGRGRPLEVLGPRNCYDVAYDFELEKTQHVGRTERKGQKGKHEMGACLSSPDYHPEHHNHDFNNHQNSHQPASGPEHISTQAQRAEVQMLTYQVTELQKVNLLCPVMIGSYAERPFAQADLGRCKFHAKLLIILSVQCI